MTNEELRQHVANKIKKLRERNGLTQQDVAIALDTTKQTISRYETGERKANQDVLYELSKVFKCSIDDFFPEREGYIEEPTLAAHIDDDVTDEEMVEIRKYIDYIKSQRD
ncbi:helix-turn-helix transcriptional regulator [Jeotgalicoccus halotolerans]|uniref:helix-turn-helix transcriptional regulator n=1 Tax=Jeotgalicoccus halotolerans TaxID=157227 RepID=UPI003514A308